MVRGAAVYPDLVESLVSDGMYWEVVLFVWIIFLFLFPSSYSPTLSKTLVLPVLGIGRERKKLHVQ